MGEGPARLFVALELPAPLPGVLVRWRAPLVSAHDWLRPVRPESLHATLCFLGERPASTLSEIARVGEAAVGRSHGGPLSLAAPLWLPRRRPRVLAVGLDDGDGWLGGLQGRLAEMLASAGHYGAEDRRFLAHVTVARVRRGVPGRPPELPAPSAATTDGARVVTLMRSELGGGPARYTRLERWPVP